MISALAWVPRGAAKEVPETVQPPEEELEAAQQALLAREADNDDDEDAENEDEEADEQDSEDEDMEEGAHAAASRARKAAAAIASGRQGSSSRAGMATDKIEAGLRELDMDNYDDSDGDGEGNLVARLLGGKGDVALDADGDPYVTLGEEEDSEDEELHIKPTDLLILAARNEDEVSNLEVWVYEEADAEGEANVYVHHDIMLPAFPLCIAWMDCSPSGSTERANMAAVGTMEPGIEIWDIDVVDAVEPAATLGGEDKAAASAAAEAGGSEDKKKKKKVRAACVLHGAGQSPTPTPEAETPRAAAPSKLICCPCSLLERRRRPRAGGLCSRRAATRTQCWASPGTSSIGMLLRRLLLMRRLRCGTSPGRPASTRSSTTQTRCRRWPGTPPKRPCCSPARSTRPHAW
jgi:periodic tryptophan protein 1